jgi:alpha-L-arabinofuranosidase
MKLTIDIEKKKEQLDDLFGLFFEDLNHAADGGLYAELIQNRSFEFAPIDNAAYHGLTAWEKVEDDGEVRLAVVTGNPVSTKNPHYLAMDVLVPGADVGIQNLGFNDGIPLKRGEQYYFTCYAKREQNLEEPLTVSLRNKNGHVYTAKSFVVDMEWKKYEFELTAPETDWEGRIAVTVSGRGKVYLDFVSLFPKDTYKGRRNGVRKDIAELLEQMHPKFMRFPGGCLVHDGALDADARDAQYRWKNTIGPLEDRPARRSNWGYNQTLGLGYFELFQLCEDLGAKPLPVIPAGYNPHYHRAVPLNKMEPFINDALDLIEFANGDPGTTVWGRKRAELGHKEPFHLEYLAIGNEEVGAEFFERYEMIHKAVREKYPHIKLINTSGPNAAGGEYNRGWESARKNKSDLVDEHYYQSPEWFLAHHHRYDSFKAEDPHVFLGEYASWGNTFYNALVEASYMIGLERNARAVKLACYAPMLCNTDYVNWKPDMIWFNQHQVYGTANYYVQKLFMNHQGDQLLEICADQEPQSVILTEEQDRISGEIILCSNETKVEYSHITLINDDTKETISFEACTLDTEEKVEQVLANVNWINYTLKLKAKELEGKKGFLIGFGKKDEKNNFFWEIGGWQNQDTIISENNHGRNSCLSQYLLEVEPQRIYELELKITGRIIKTYVDGALYHTVESKPVVIEPLYYSASKEEATGDIIIKAVNVSDTDRETTIAFKGMKNQVIQGTKYTMEGYELEAQNDFEHPDYVIPTEEKLTLEEPVFPMLFPKQSVTIIRIFGK